MLLNNIDFPHELIKAAKDNKLVVFAGAGVSVGRPTCYPDFCQLINEIYTRKIGAPIEEKNFPPDVYAGDLVRLNVPVHDIVAETLNLPGIKTNRLHKSIINLFRNNEIRVVTTNFDLMIEKAAKQMKYGKYNSYSYPALPDGCDFSGVVHLHGDVHNPKSIVITDTDFGKAYLVDGYATQFITNVFKTYTVLFIGYSYDDVMMSYLTKALSTSINKSAYILTCERINKWNSIGIEPLFYEYKNYDQLYQGFEEFSDYCGRQLLDVEDTINIITSNDPPDDEATISVIKELFTELDLSKLFLSKIHKEEWFDFFYKQGFIYNLFESKAILTDIERAIAHWVARNCLNEKLLVAIELSKNVINPDFERFISIHLVDLGDDYFSQYAVLMLPRIKDAWIIHSHLEKAIEIGNDILAAHVFVKMISPSFVLEKSFGYFGLEKKTEMKELFPLSACMSSDWDLLRKSIKNKTVYYYLASEATTIISTFYDVESVINNPRKFNNISLDFIDLDSFSDDKPVSIIANVLLASLSNIQNESYSKGWVDEQLKTNKTLLRRIAIYHTGHDTIATSSFRDNVVLGLKDLVKTFEKKELYYLLCKCLNDISSEKSSEVVKRIEDQYLVGDENIQYEIYNLVYWLTEQNSNIDSLMMLKSLLARIIDDHPDYMPKKHPEVDIALGEVTYGDGINPNIVQSIIGKTYEQLDSVLEECQSKYHADSFDVWASLRKASASEPNWASKCIVDYVKHDLVNSNLITLVEGISLASDYSFVNGLFEDLACLSIPTEISLPLCRLMFNTVHSFERIDSKQVDKILNVIKLLWSSSRPWIGDDEFSYQRSLNSPSGNIGFTLCDLIAKCERQREAIIDYIDSVVDDEDVDFLCVMVGHATFLYAINSVWTEKRILPLLKSESTSVYSAYWESLLSVSRNLSFEYAHSIKPYYDYAIASMSCFNEQTTMMFAKQYAILVTYESSDPLNDATCFIRSTDENANNAFLTEVTYILRYLATDKLKKDIWKKWLRRFVENRISNIPKSLTGREVIILLEWSIYICQDDFDDLVSLIVKMKEVDNNTLLHFLYGLNSYENYKRNSRAAVKILYFLDSLGVSFRLYADNIRTLYEIWKKDGISVEDERTVKSILLKSNASW